jgi:parallel beta-helix repeat protein
MQATMKTRIAFAAFTCCLAWAGGRPALAQVSCNDVITTKVVMTGDLNCAVSPGVTIGEKGALDMAGFTLSCDGTDVGIALTGPKGKLSNGVVSGCALTAVDLGGTGGHKVTGVLTRNSGVGFTATSNRNKVINSNADNNTDGFSFSGDGNVLLSVAATRNSATGINVGGNKNKIVDAIADNSFYGVTLSGDGNKMTRVVSSNHFFDAFTVGGDGNKLSGSTAVNNGGQGFFVVGDGNKLTRNSAIDSNGHGIQLAGGSGMSVKKCLVSGAGSDGINAVDNGHSLSGNSIFEVNGTGIYVSGVDSSIKKNVAVNSGAVDFDDANVGCANTWSKNTGSKGQVCIE